MSAPPQSGIVDESPRRRGGWIPATVIVLVIFGLVCAPLLLALAAPARAEGTVGVYERVTMRAEEGESPAIGGFIAPQGWQRSDDDSAEPGFLLEEGGGFALVTVSLSSEAEDADALLRDGIPAGAGLSPIRPLELGAGLDVSVLEFDLQAGDGVTQRIAACSQLRPQHCLLFVVQSAGLDGEGPDSLLPEVRAMVQSAEVL